MLNHLGRKKMVAILQTTNIFSLGEMVVFYSYSTEYVPSSQAFIIDSDNGLAMRQDISWTNADPVHWLINASTGSIVLMQFCQITSNAIGMF